MQAQSFSVIYNGTTYNHKETMTHPVKINNNFVINDIAFHNNTDNNMNVIASCIEVSGHGMTVTGASNGLTSVLGYYTNSFTIPSQETNSSCSFTLNIPGNLQVGDTGKFIICVSDASTSVPDTSAGSYVFVNFVITPDAGYVFYAEDFEDVAPSSQTYSYLFFLPSDWTSISDNNTNYSDYTAFGQGWCVVNWQGMGKAATSISYLSTATATADRWLISPTLNHPLIHC